MKVFEYVPLSDIVFYKIGGKARFVIHIEERGDIEQAFAFLRQNNIANIRIIGLGSNTLQPDSAFDGAILLLRGHGKDITIDPSSSQITIFSGETMDSLIQFSFQYSLGGLEWAGGLPSTVGGAIRGNAGAFGSEIKDSVVSVQALDMKDPQLAIQTFSHTQSEFSYRNSFFKEHPEFFIISGTFKTTPLTGDELQNAKKVYESNIDYRNTHHPVEFPSCGSVFKNITSKEQVEKILSVWPDVRELSEKKWHNKVSMGYIINRLGFSGKEVGGARVSEKHTNYIINKSHATSKDVRTLIEQIQQAFSKTFGFVPEPEVMLIEDIS